MMGKNKSLAAKKRQRKRQKQRKLKLLLKYYDQDPQTVEQETAQIEQIIEDDGEIEVDGQPTNVNTTSNGYDQPVTDRDTISDSGAHDQPTVRTSDVHNVEQVRAAAANRLPPGYSKHTTGVVYYGGFREEDQAKLQFVQSLPLKEQVIELHRLFFDRTEAAAYFRDKSVKQDEEIEEMQLDFAARMKKVREFWKDKIYNEHSRAGKLLKFSMQN